MKSKIVSIFLVACLLLSGFAGVGAAQATYDDDNQTIAVVANEDNKVASLSVAGSAENAVSYSQVVYVGEENNLYRPGALTANKLAEDGDDVISTIGVEDTSTANDYFSNIMQDEDLFLYEQTYNFESNSLSDLSIQIAENYHVSATDAYVAYSGDEEEVAIASYLAKDNGVLLIVDDEEELDEVNNAMDNLGVTDAWVGDSLNHSEFDGDERTVESFEGVPETVNDDYDNVSTLYVVDSPTELTLVNSVVEGDEDVYYATESTEDTDLPESDETMIIGESSLEGEVLSYSTVDGLASQLAHIKNGVDAPTVAVSNVEVDEDDVTVTVANVGDYAAIDSVVEIGMTEEVDVNSEEDFESSFEDETLSVNLNSISAGDEVEFTYDGSFTTSEPEVESYSMSGSSDEFAGFSTWDVPDWATPDVPEWLTSLQEEIEDIQEGLSTLNLMFLTLGGVLVIAGVYLWRKPT